MTALVSEFLEVISDLFESVFGWCFDFLFNTLGGSFVSLGSSAYTFFYNLVADSLSSGKFFYAIFGCIIGFFIFKIVIRIIRG